MDHAIAPIGFVKPGLWSHLAHLERLPGLTVESVDWHAIEVIDCFPMIDQLDVRLCYRGHKLLIGTDYEMRPFLMADPDVPSEIFEAVFSHIEKCKINRPIAAARMSARFARNISAHERQRPDARLPAVEGDDVEDLRLRLQMRLLTGIFLSLLAVMAILYGYSP